VRGRPLPRQEDDPAYWTPKEVKPEDRGTPLVGRIRSNGTAEADEDWQEEWGRRVPARFGKGFDIYAMEIEGTQQCVVFHNIPAWEFREGEAALYAWDGCEAKGWFGRVMLLPLAAIVITIDGTRHRLDPETIVRIGKVVGRWSAESEIRPFFRRESHVGTADGKSGDVKFQRGLIPKTAARHFG